MYLQTQAAIGLAMHMAGQAATAVPKCAQIRLWQRGTEITGGVICGLLAQNTGASAENCENPKTFLNFGEITTNPNVAQM